MVAIPGLADFRGLGCARRGCLGSPLSPGSPSDQWPVSANMPGDHERRRGGDGHALRLCHGGPSRVATRRGHHGRAWPPLILTRSSQGVRSAWVSDHWASSACSSSAASLASSPRLTPFCFFALRCWAGSPSYRILGRLPSWVRGLARVVLVGAARLGYRCSCPDEVRSRLSLPRRQPARKSLPCEDYLNFGK